MKQYNGAAGEEQAQVQDHLGFCLLCCVDRKRNLKEVVKRLSAVPWWGHSNARYEPDCCLKDGIGCRKNTKKAVSWYRKAAEQGDEDAKAALQRLGQD